MNKGIIYFVDDPCLPTKGRHDGNKFIKECAISIKSITKFHKLPITIFTNHKEDFIKKYIPQEVNIINIDHNEYKKLCSPDKITSYCIETKPNRILCLKNSPYEYSLYLDNDTEILHPVVEDIFNILNNFDIPMVHAGHISEQYGSSIPACFPEFNCGVIGYRKSKTQELFNTWLKLYCESMSSHDQGTFRIAIYNSGLKIATLPPQYNWRHNGVPLSGKQRPINKKEFVKLDWWKRMPEVRIIHNRDMQNKL